MEIIHHYLKNPPTNRSFGLDITYSQDGQPKPILIFAHGFKGFKDWGHWSQIAKEFAKAGFVFIKFNFSHNGTTIEQPQDFADLEAFGHNNYMLELADFKTVLDWVHAEHCSMPKEEINLEDLTIIGHSRGGGIAILQAARDARVTRLITWAAVSSLGYAWQNEKLVENWKKEGVNYIFNGRTKQEMPLYFQLYENFQANKDILDVTQATKSLDKPFLIVHGDVDPAVPLLAAEELNSWNNQAKLHVIQGANHVFGGKHPFEESELPAHSRELCEVCINFCKSNP